MSNDRKCSECGVSDLEAALVGHMCWNATPADFQRRQMNKGIVLQLAPRWEQLRGISAAFKQHVNESTPLESRLQRQLLGYCEQLEIIAEELHSQQLAADFSSVLLGNATMMHATLSKIGFRSCGCALEAHEVLEKLGGMAASFDTKLQALLVELEAVHGWAGMVDMWIDRYAIQRLRITYNVETKEEGVYLDKENIFHEKDNEPRISNDEFVMKFIAECKEGL